MSNRFSRLGMAELERLAYQDPDDPTAPPVEIIRQAQTEIERRDAQKFTPRAIRPIAIERVNGIRI